MKRNNTSIAIYSRKSKFTGKGESVENQVELCKAYIRTHYGEKALENTQIYEDEGFSGADLKRPAFQRMIEDVKKRRFSAIIVYRLDRISRNISDFSGLIEELSRLDVAFVSIKEQFDTGTPMGRAMMYIASVFSQLERETIAERIRDNMHELAKTGRWLGGTTPTGYVSESVKSVTVDGKTKKACKLALIPEEAEIIKTIFMLFLESHSLTITEAELMKRRIVTKNGNYFTRFSIKNILQNPVYLMADEDAYRYFIDNEAELFSDKDAFDGIHGLLAYNRTDQQKGRATVINPINEWIVSVGQHPGIISGREWVTAQAILNQNKSKSYRRPRKNEALLTGLIYCRCGSRMHPKLTKRTMSDGSPLYSYVCRMKERSQRSLCASKNVAGNTLDLAIVEEIKKLSEDKSTFLQQLEQCRRLYTSGQAQTDEQLSTLKKEKAALEKKVVGLVDTLTELDGHAARMPILKRMEALQQESDALSTRIQELEALTAQNTINDMEFEVMRQLLSVFGSAIDEMSVEQKRSAVRSLVRKVIWDGENAHVILFGASEDDVEYPDLTPLYSQSPDESTENDELTEFADVDYSEDDLPLLGENSK